MKTTKLENMHNKEKSNISYRDIYQQQTYNRCEQYVGYNSTTTPRRGSCRTSNIDSSRDMLQEIIDDPSRAARTEHYMRSTVDAIHACAQNISKAK